MPSQIERWISGDPAASEREMKALLGMVKLDLPTLEGEDVTV